MKALILALAGLGLCCVAQTRVRLEGQVTSTTGEPVRKVSVQLVAQRAAADGQDESNSPKESYTTVTDSSGRFAFDSLPGGRFAIYFRHAGYMPGETEVIIDPRQPPAQVAMRLTPMGRIEGTVTDEDGEPYRGSILINDKGPERIGADGTYVVTVNPGRYFVHAQPDPQPGGIGGETVAVWPRDIDVVTYYPSAITSDGATRVNATAGAVIRGIDIRVRRVTVYAVRGRAMDEAGGGPLAHTEIQLVSDGKAAAATTSADGSFEFKDVQPGTYLPTTSRSANSPVAVRLYSLVPVVVRSGNVEDLELDLRPGAEILGRITMESGEPVKVSTGARVTLRGKYGNRGSQIFDGGIFSISDLEPQKYLLQIFNQPPHTYVKSVLLNHQGVGVDIDLSSGTGGAVEVVLSPHAAEISGTIRDSRGAPASSIRVTVWKPGRPTGVSLVPLEAIAFTDSSGAFRFGDLAPGEYRVAAWSNSVSASTMEPELLSQFDNRAVVVKLQEDQSVSVEVPLIPADEIDRAMESVR